MAGATLALALANTGLEIQLLDRARFPRQVACGEGLSLAGATILDSLPGMGNLFDLPHEKLFSYRIVGKSDIQIGNNSSKPRVIGIQRSILDTELHRVISNYPQITIRPECSVVEVLQSGESVTATLADGEQIRARCLVLASGKNRALLDRAGFKVTSYMRDRKYGVSAHFVAKHPTQATGMVVFVESDYEVYCTPVGAGLWNVNLLATKERLSQLARNKRLLALALSSLDRLEISADQVSPFVGAGPFGFRASEVRRGRIWLVGDVRESLDPVGGMGMTHAILTSCSAAWQIRQYQRVLFSPTLTVPSSTHLRTMTEGARFLIRGIGRSSWLSYLAQPGLLQVVENRMQARLHALLAQLVGVGL